MFAIKEYADLIPEIVQLFLAACSTVVLVGGAAVYIYKAVINMKKPDKERDETLATHTKQLDNDNRRLKELEDSNKVIMHSLLAIMSHELDGNHTDQLRKAHDELKDYLVNR